MDNYIYTVEIPAILNLLLNYETREFKDSNPRIAREKAIIYLSDIIKKAIEREIITIKFFTDNNSLELKKIEKKIPFIVIPRISDCSIENHSVFSRIHRTLVQQWPLCLYLE